MAKDVIMPKFGFTQETAEIVRWLKQPGDAVDQGDPIAEVTTDKVNMEVEAPVSGILDGLRFQPGDVVPVTQVIAVIRGVNETLPAAAMPAPPTPPAAPAAAPPSPAPSGSASVPARATPLAAKVADERGIDLGGVTGSGPGGRITRQDVEARLVATPPDENDKVRAVPAARRLGRELGIDLRTVSGSGPRGRVQSVDVLAEEQRQASAAVPAPLPVATSAAVAAPAAASIPMTGMRRTIATRLQRSAQESPHIYFEADIDVTQAEALRARANKLVGEGQPRVSLTAIIARVCAWALKRHPLVNSRLDGDSISLLADVNIGVAVALDEGLIVPVLRQVDQKGLTQIAAETADLAERARSNRLRPDEVQDGTFTISNLGMFGVDRFTAIINPPQAAILAVGRTVRRLVPDENDQPVVRPILTVTLSADHRVIDGAVAARFLSDVRAALENPELLVL